MFQCDFVCKRFKKNDCIIYQLQEIVLNIDLAPTFIDLAGGTPLDIMDGVSMKEIFDTSEGKGLTFVFSNFYKDPRKLDGLI